MLVYVLLVLTWMRVVLVSQCIITAHPTVKLVQVLQYAQNVIMDINYLMENVELFAEMELLQVMKDAMIKILIIMMVVLLVLLTQSIYV